MPIKLTLDLYSGRENPTVVLKGKQASDAIERLTVSRKLRADEVKSRPLPDSTLGYRGILVEQLSDASDELPGNFRVAHGDLYTSKPLGRATDEDFETFAFGLFDRKQVPKVRDFQTEVERFRGVRGSIVIPPIVPVKPSCPCAPLYEPAWWNDGGQKQYNNNCYNYATNYRSDTFAQPGRANGAMYPLPIASAGVHAGAITDALTDQTPQKNACPGEGHLVALVIAPGFDFHWYRRGRFGRWTHKPGGTPATDKDNAGNTIIDPRTADRGPYTEFVGFMLVMHGHIKIN